MVERERRLLLITGVGLPSLFLLGLWLADWITGVFHVMTCFGFLVSALVGNRMAVNTSSLWAIPFGLAMFAAYLLLPLCIAWATGAERTAGGLPWSLFGAAAAFSVWLSLNAIWVARSQRRQMAQADALAAPSAKNSDSRN